MTSKELQEKMTAALIRRTNVCGSTLYSMTWKAHITPAHRLLFRLRGSARRTSETETSGWLSPQAIDAQGEGRAGRLKRDDGVYRQPTSAGNFRQDLKDQVLNCLAGWVTPTTRDHKDGVECPNVLINALLGRVSWLAGWPTPNTNNTKGAYQDEALIQKRKEAGRQQNLQDIARLLKEHPQAARLTASGEMLIGSSAGMESGGQLNPAHSRWLQALPKAWCEAAIMAFRSMPIKQAKRVSCASEGTGTPSTRKPQKRLSKATLKLIESLC